MLAMFAVGSVFAASPASACRVPRAKDRNGYTRLIRTLFTAWWSRDYPAFANHFRHRDVAEPFNGRAIFHQHFAQTQPRLLGEILFNGSSAVVQVVTPQGPNPERGLCGGHASADLILVQFYPGLAEPVVAQILYVDGGILAPEEWRTADMPTR